MNFAQIQSNVYIERPSLSLLNPDPQISASISAFLLSLGELITLHLPGTIAWDAADVAFVDCFVPLVTLNRLW